jgi:hypothetical protein
VQKFLPQFLLQKRPFEALLDNNGFYDDSKAKAEK